MTQSDDIVLWLLLLLLLLVVLVVVLVLVLVNIKRWSPPFSFPIHMVLPQIMARWKRMLSVKDAQFLCDKRGNMKLSLYSRTWYCCSGYCVWQCSLIPSRRCAQAECEPEHGRADQGRRRFPLLVKDVAGLVPGGRPCLPFGVRVRFPNAGIIEFVCNLSLPQK